MVSKAVLRVFGEGGFFQKTARHYQFFDYLKKYWEILNSDCLSFTLEFSLYNLVLSHLRDLSEKREKLSFRKLKFSRKREFFEVSIN